MTAEGWYDGTCNDWRWKTRIGGVPRVHRTLRLDGRGTGNVIGQTSGIRPSTPRAVIHGSMVTDGAM